MAACSSDRFCATSGVCSAGGDHAVARYISAAVTCPKDRQWKIPRRDRDKDAATAHHSTLLSPVGPGIARRRRLVFDPCAA
jgi:hypothetical protein